MENNSNMQANPSMDNSFEESNARPKKGLGMFLKISLFGVLVGLVGLFVYEYLRIAPDDVRFTNVTSSSVTVSWNTKSPISATAMVFEGDTWMPVTVLGLGGERFYDTRDVTKAKLEETYKVPIDSEELSFSVEDIQTEITVEEMGEYYTHHVTLTGLNPETEYSFMIGDTYLFRKIGDASGGSSVETTAVPENISPPFPAYGSIKDAEGREAASVEELVAVSDGVVYFNYLDQDTGERSTVHSGSLNEGGNWYIDVSLLGKFVSERLNQEDLLVELEVDAGPQGLWKKGIDINLISPVESVIINDPLAHRDFRFGVEQIGTLL